MVQVHIIFLTDKLFFLGIVPCVQVGFGMVSSFTLPGCDLKTELPL